VQELAYALATAVAVLDAVKASGQVAPDDFPSVVGRISFFVNAGIRFVEELCKMRAFTAMWDRICADRYGVADPKLRRFRYGMQVNSLGLTEAQPENNVQRIILEMLGVTLSKDARARAVQLPTWNEALGLPRPWDQQWSLRYQQVLAYETDLLEYDDIFTGSAVVEAKTAELAEAAAAELDEILALGGAFEAIEEMKSRLVMSQADRSRRIEEGAQVVVGVNRFVEGAPSPLGGEESILRVDPAVEAEVAAGVAGWRSGRTPAQAEAVSLALRDLQAAARSDVNVMPATIALARAGGTTGEWGRALRDVFGEYRAPTGVARAVGHRGTLLASVADRVGNLAGGPPRLLVAKPGLDGHSNGAEQIAVAARDAGMEVVYAGIRSTVPQIVAAARDEDVDLIGVSILSGSHLELLPTLIQALRNAGVDAPVVVGGIIPEEDRSRLADLGIAAVYTPKDFELARIMDDLVGIVERHRHAAAVSS
jgi:(2R)-ethylmalonyl-CoA mutase